MTLTVTLVKAGLEAVFRVLFEYDCHGEENVPREGPAVVAANHPSYLDPILLSLQIPRLIRFMAWDRLFRVPLMGPLMRAFGAFPVDVTPGKGREAYERAKSLVLEGEVVGIFPEGKRSRTGWMEGTLREGAARLSWETGAPLVPATITGAFRAWPHSRSVPHPARIQVRFHPGIDPAPFQSQTEEEALPAMLAEVRRRVERTLLPGVKADLKRNVLWAGPAPWPKVHEWAPPLALALLLFWKQRAFLPVLPAYAYLGYLLLDYLVLPQGRLAKWVRNGSSALFLLLFAPRVLAAFGVTPAAAPGALLALLAGVSLAYLYERTTVGLAYVRGLVGTGLLEMGAQWLSPTPLGPHVAFPVFAAAYAWERQSVFWRYALPVLVAWPFVMAWQLDLAPRPWAHVVAGLLGWLLARLSAGPREDPVEEEAPPVVGLGLRS